MIEYIIIGKIIVIGLMLIGISITKWRYGSKKINNEKISGYECGFEGIGKGRGKYEINYYIISILFIIFDLEVIFIVPYSILIEELDILGYWIIYIFILILTLGFVYEWKSGVIDMVD